MKTQPLLNAINFNKKMNAAISFPKEENLSLVSFARFRKFSLHCNEAYEQI